MAPSADPLSPYIWCLVTRFVPAGENVTWRGPSAALDRPLAPFYDQGEGTVARVFVNGQLVRWGHDVFAGEHPEYGELRFSFPLNERSLVRHRLRGALQALWIEACERRPVTWTRLLYFALALPHLWRMTRKRPGNYDILAICPTPY